MENVDKSLLEIALEKTSGDDFEKFINDFGSSIFGYTFIPLGGHKDGGADAFLDTIYEIKEKQSVFIQTSIQQDYKTKISNTIKRLKEFGRAIKLLYYFTSRGIDNIDVIEDELSEKFKVIIKIRDKKWILSSINNNQSTKSAFYSYLEKYTFFLKKIGSTSIASNINARIPDEIILFLSKELDNTGNDEKILFKICDGLILWSLEGTDPDKNILMAEEEIKTKIFLCIPQTEKIIKGIVHKRLVSLRKAPKKERQIRYHGNQKKYCLTYEIREKIYEENVHDEKLLIDVKNIFKQRIRNHCNNISENDTEIGADICLKTIQKMFEEEGYKLTIAINNISELESTKIASDTLDLKICEHSDIELDTYIFKNALIENLRLSFYESTQLERDLFRRYSILYTLLFTINTDPRVLEYFQNMTTELNLYIGSDILIRALSERYLAQENQTTRNTLKIIIEAGGKLILSEPVYKEVYFHLRNTNYEYVNHFQIFDETNELYILENSDRILIRAYAYNRKKDHKLTWKKFIESFCSFEGLIQDRAFEEVKLYLISQFKLIYETEDYLKGYYDEEELNKLKNQLLEWKKNEELAKNDAMMALSIYGKRDRNNEYKKIKEFGYSTWWFTGESYILKFTTALIRKKRSRYMMRPEFILKYMTFAPNYNEARKLYNNVFPSIMGIKLVRRVDKEIIDDLLKEAEKLKGMEEGRKFAKIHDLSNKLKSDFRKKYFF